MHRWCLLNLTVQGFSLNLTVRGVSNKHCLLTFFIKFRQPLPLIKCQVYPQLELNSNVCQELFNIYL